MELSEPPKLSRMEVNMVIVRHGETQANKDGIVQGQADVPLNDLGRHQARMAGDRLSNEVFDVVYSSDLCRAAETADIILERNGNGAPKVVLRWEKLRERGFGVMQGGSISDYAEAARMAGAVKKPWTFTPPGGETMEEMRQRVVECFQDLCKDFIKRSATVNRPLQVLIVSHGGLIKELLFHLVSSVKRQECKKLFSGCKQMPGNASISIIKATFGSGQKLETLECSALHDVEHIQHKVLPAGPCV